MPSVVPATPCALGCAAIDRVNPAAWRNAPNVRTVAPEDSEQRGRSGGATAPPHRLRGRAAQSGVPYSLQRRGDQPRHSVSGQHGLVRPRKKKHHTKRCLRLVKAQWRLFQQLVADTKYLQDIPFYWPQMRRWGLPLFQYTVRETVSGLCLTGYADERSKSYAVLLAERVSAHLAWHGVDLSGVEWQTDNGSEFLEDDHQRGLPSLVRTLGSGHHYIPPKVHPAWSGASLAE